MPARTRPTAKRKRVARTTSRHPRHAPIGRSETAAVARLRAICLALPDRLLTGDTLLIGATGRTDLPTGDPEALYDSLFDKLLKRAPALLIYPAHDYQGQGHSTLGRELAENPRLQVAGRAAFVAQMSNLNLTMPRHLTEALRTNLSGGKTVAQLIAEAGARVPFMSMAEVKQRVEAGLGDRRGLPARHRPGRSDQVGVRGVARFPASAGAAGPGTGRGHDRADWRAAG